MVRKFRKKPVVVEAIQLTWDNWGNICDFMKIPKQGKGITVDLPKIAMEIYTLEGTMRATENDWIIKGINGEFYSCKPDVFDKTYQSVDSEIEVVKNDNRR